MKKQILKNFIVFEGLDGAGTSTQSKLLQQKINNSYLTFEPADNPIGRMIRECLKKNMDMSQEALTHLFIADRAEHLFGKEKIFEKCGLNRIVISDRYFFSTYAYQGLNTPIGELMELNSDFPMPQIVFFINTSIENCQKRINTRGEKEELFEKASIQQKILDNYLFSLKEYEKIGLNVFYLDGNLSIDALLDMEVDILKKENII